MVLGHPHEELNPLPNDIRSGYPCTDFQNVLQKRYEVILTHLQFECILHISQQLDI